MGWIKSHIGNIITLVVLVVAMAVAWGGMTVQCDRIDAKADKEPVYRELDRIQEQLVIIDGKLDAIMQHTYNSLPSSDL